ncbi:hypothetical protein [Pontibacter ummariensis]|nr:hypothetical protein [Pontibacter ummariensis]
MLSIAQRQRGKEDGTALSGKTRPRFRRAPTPDVERITETMKRDINKPIG